MDATLKQLALGAVEALPADDATFGDAMERLYLLEKIARGRADARAGRTVPHEEAVARFGQRWAAARVPRPHLASVPAQPR